MSCLSSADSRYPLNYQLFTSHITCLHFSLSFILWKVVETYGGWRHTAEMTVRITPLRYFDKTRFSFFGKQTTIQNTQASFSCYEQ